MKHDFAGTSPVITQSNSNVQRSPLLVRLPGTSRDSSVPLTAPPVEPWKTTFCGSTKCFSKVIGTGDALARACAHRSRHRDRGSGSDEHGHRSHEVPHLAFSIP